MITFEHVTFTYPAASRPALTDVSLTIPEGAFALVSGPSGAGKSTLLRCINGLVPHFTGGLLAGAIRVAGVDPVLVSPQRMSAAVGFVFQDPESQFVADRVDDEIAFVLENAAVPEADMARRIADLLQAFDLSGLRRRRLTTLSGGEKQRVAIASALALHPGVLVLDEPTSQLDPEMAQETLQWLLHLKQARGLTVVVAEHRLERVLPFADLMVHLDQSGASLLVGPPAMVVPHLVHVPPVIALGKALGWHPLPLTVEEARTLRAASGRSGALSPLSATQPPAAQPAPPPVLKAAGLEVAYGTTPALCGVSLELCAGELVVLLGRNGAGKTTLLRSLVGLERPDRGEIQVEGQPIAGQSVVTVCRKVGYLPQDPNHLLFADTVGEELLITLRNHGLSAASAPVAREALLTQLGLLDKADRYPRDLSTGERQRVALGAIMVTKPRVLLLDEPTRGLDYAAKQALLAILRVWRAEGVAILLVTHDVELAASAADRVLLMHEGRIVAEGTPSRVLRAMPDFTPQIARLFPDSDWLTLDDALAGLSAPDSPG